MNIPNPVQPPVALTIAGSDCSSGAGIQADLKTFSHHGCHGLTAITCVVAETPEHVESIHPVPSAILQEQIDILLRTYPVKAIKTGMLYSKAPLSSCLRNVREYKDRSRSRPCDGRYLRNHSSRPISY